MIESFQNFQDELYDKDMEYIIIISLLLVFTVYIIFTWNKKRSLDKKSNITFAYHKLAASFVDMGLSLIGRKTPDTNNHLLTAESEKMRENIEKNFLETLFLQYSDVKIRDVLMKHFMLFKEAMLYRIFRILFRDKIFYDLVYGTLTSRLSEGLTFSEAQEQHVYRTVFIEYYDDAFKQTQKVQQAIPASFWMTAADKYPEYFSARDSLDLFRNYFLCDIFLYSYDTIEGVSKDWGMTR